MCIKKKYISYTHARADAKAMRHKRHIAFNVYRCRERHRWHIGSAVVGTGGF